MSAPPRSSRLTGGPLGFAVAFAVCLAFVAAILVITPRRHSGAAPAVDYSMDLVSYRRLAPYPVPAPEGLPPTWRPISSRLTGGAVISWHLGFTTPAEEYAALEVSDERSAEFVRRMTGNGASLGPTGIGGVSWQRRIRADKEQRSLYRTDGPVTIVVTGTAGWDELTTLAAALRRQPRPTP